MNYAKQYQELHNSNIKLYSGQLNDMQVMEITTLVEKHNPVNLLDYGSGKGYQYLRDRVHEQWGGLLPYCYDPGVQPLSKRPNYMVFGGVICTDVMEHIQEQDIDDVLRDIFGFLENDGFAYFYICTRASKRKLPDGRGVHLTVKPALWWDDKFKPYVGNYHVVIDYGI